MKQGEAGFIRSFVSVVGTVLLLMLLALAVAVAGVPAATQGAALTVLSGSMEPTFSPGDQIIVKGVKDPASQIAVGDIVTFMPHPNDPTLITHRVIGKGVSSDGQVSFTTRGDANTADDDPIGPQQIRGKYIYKIPYLGHLTVRVGGSGRLVVILLAIGLLAYAAFTLLKPGRKSETEPDGQNLTEAASSSGWERPSGGLKADHGSSAASARPTQRGHRGEPEPVVSAEQLAARGSATLQQRWQATHPAARPAVRPAAQSAEASHEADLATEQSTTIEQGVRT